MSFPFDIIVVTSPDSNAALAAESGPLSAIKSKLPNGTHVLSTSDPFDVRCGSGGGTLAALDLADATFDCNGENPSVLIVHAGGQSSRCPTQMALGKAWTSLPLMTEEGKEKIGNPTALLIQSLGSLFEGAPKGTVAVAASDVLLSLEDEQHETAKIDWSQCKDDQVIGLAVPAPLETAANHGVYVVTNNERSDIKTRIQQVTRFLQKPSMDTMRQTISCTFACSEHNEEESAWIDTGIVAFLPQSATALRNLANGLLKSCTARGLKNLFEESNEEEESLEAFSKRTALRIELYSHLMFALSTAKENGMTKDGLSSYLECQQGDSVNSDVLSGIYHELSRHELKTCIIPTGQFVHLGTTREMLDFLTRGASWKEKNIQYSDLDITTVDADRRSRDFGRRIRLAKRSESFLALPGSRSSSSLTAATDPSCVVMNSMLSAIKRDTDTVGPFSIGTGTVIEHSSLVCPAGFRVGEHCLLSGLRGFCDADIPIDIPDRMCLQMLPLKQQKGLVYMYFGVNDDIKKCNTIYGMDMYCLLEQTGLTLFDIWDPQTLIDRKNTLWNAKIHPIFPPKLPDANLEFMHGPLFSWITAVRRESPDAPLPESARESLQLWKAQPRLSFEEIRELSDAYEEFYYRDELEETVIPCAKARYAEHLQAILLGREHKECHFEPVLDEFITHENSEFLKTTMAILDGVAEEGIKQSKYDVSSRTFMVMSALLDDIGELIDKVEGGNIQSEEENQSMDGVENQGFKCIHVLSSTSANETERLEAIEQIKVHRDAILSYGRVPPVSRAFRQCSSLMEEAGLALIELCVSGSTSRAHYTEKTTCPAPVDTWVVASAPARVDLAGGWSDTPPLSYEFGGAVSGLAVKVDGQNPLSARCRVRSGTGGILLRTEGRDSDGTLLSETDIVLKTVGDLADFKNPLADCALMKCALVFFGLVPLETLFGNGNKDPQDLQPFINKFCGRDDIDVGLEIISLSRLPRGSGMGTSSILGGCVLASIGKCIGVMDPETTDDDHLIQAVLTLEQLLSTGGGWQDQVGGLVGGFKLGTSDAHVIPLRTHVQRMAIPERVRKELDQRLILAYTGQTRLAKNILQNVLRRWARRSPEIVQTVEELVKGAQTASAAMEEGDVDQVGECLNAYWNQKKMMAGGENSGAEPSVVKEVLEELLHRKEIAGGSLCGAGGGGFMILMARAGRTGADLQELVESELVGHIQDLNLFTWHECSVSGEGLTITFEN